MYIDKASVIAEIERRMQCYSSEGCEPNAGKWVELISIEHFIDTLEVKEVDSDNNMTDINFEEEIDNFMYGTRNPERFLDSVQVRDKHTGLTVLDWKCCVNNPKHKIEFAKYFFELGLKMNQKGGVNITQRKLPEKYKTCDWLWKYGCIGLTKEHIRRLNNAINVLGSLNEHTDAKYLKEIKDKLLEDTPEPNIEKINTDMNYKEKYEEALSRARVFSQRWHGIEATDSELALQELKEVFPELKESEESWIPKEITKYPKEKGDFRYCWITWLEKKGEWNTASKTEPMVEGLTTEFQKQVSHIIASAMDKEHEYIKGYIEWVAQSLLGYAKNEQTSADNVEPKFKVGDWIIEPRQDEPDYLWHIDRIKDDCYWRDAASAGVKIAYADKECRLWTIQDAKDGDVLTWDDSKCIALFKEIYNKHSFKSHGCIDACTEAFENWTFHDIENAHPATTEQRYLLFQKMHEAGYEWDVKKKELNKIEQKSKEKTIFYDSMDDLIADALIEEIENSEMNGKSKHNRIFWIKSHRQKSVWSEEDERMINSIVKNLDEGEWFDIYQADWLRALKERMKGE